MNKKNKRYSIRKILMAAAIFAGIILLLITSLNLTPKGKTEAQVSVPILTKNENRALRRYNNNFHLELAQAKGLKKPLVSKDEYKTNPKKFERHYDLDEITDNKYYEIPHLTNSLPYLQEPAGEFLDLLGETFCDQLEELGIRKYRFSVTSILRTLEDQKSLRKNNVNATPNNSSHYYGRSFDISQTRFFERGNSAPVYTYRLRNILLRVLIKLQAEGKCYVLLESQTKCIHVTVR
ncbi:hypothetical protein EO244_05160 [Ancylomarina salipaludis]|uniref:Uncharacterized protein n=1 Tax=Ancylomarina salipaludis TaxID=2501299 RepID=A0A4V1N0D0_9BACT|nr:DUF5715 family protein [Ancylomarina salipaludis]RXQ96222.1 hypothetical protein EO244_05160 [Ancylomarina salipaludis]